MVETAMPGPIFSLVLLVHIASGTLAAIVLFPIQLFGPKGHFHARAGRLALIDTWVILISGFTLLLDPLFLVYWKHFAADLSTMRHNYVHVFANAMDAWLFFVYLDVLLAYLVLTGVGTWSRLRAGNRKEGFPVRRSDAVLTLVAIALTAFMFWVGLRSIGNNNSYAFITIGSAVVMAVIYVCDLATWRDRGRHVKAWWALHAWKLALAWAALVYAVFLRWRVRSQEIDGLTAEFALLVIAAMVGVIGVYSWRQQRRRRTALQRRALAHQAGSEPS